MQKNDILSRVFQRLTMLFAGLLFVTASAFANSYYKYVGETFYLPIPDAPGANAYVNSWSYSCTNSSVSITNGGSSSPSSAVITSYFSGTVTIECFYSYVTYINGYPRGGTGRTYHMVTCRSNDISISAPKHTLDVGESMQMTYSFSAITYDARPEIDWKSSNSSVATVDYSGRVAARQAGCTTISAKSNLGGNVASYEIEVRKIDPTSVSISPSLTAYVGESFSVDVTLYPSNAQTSLTWHSANTKVASVSGGSVKGLDEGKTTIYCTTSNGIRSNDCEVTVYYRTATGVKVSSPSLYVPIGESRTLSWSPVPSNARTSVTWKSDKPSIATVSQSGSVKGVNPGVTTVRVTTDNGKTASCTVTVPPDPDNISLPEKVSLYLGRTRSLKLTTTPADAYTKCVWSSSDADVASVTADGTINARHPGRTVITAKTQNGKVSRCAVEVPEPTFMLNLWQCAGEKMTFPLSEKPKITEKDGVLFVSTTKAEFEMPAAALRKFTVADAFANEVPSAISLTPELTLAYKERSPIQLTFYPLGYDVETTLRWQSSDSRVATVTDKGEVYGRHPGQCDITATTANGKQSKCHVTVLGHDAYLVLWPWSGEKVEYHLSTSPRIKHSDGRFWVISDDVEIGYPESEVRKFTLGGDFMDVPTGVDEAIPGNDDFGLTLSQARPGSSVSIFALGGQLVETFTVGADGEWHYSLDGQPAGVYIIKTESTTIKIHKK